MTQQWHSISDILAGAAAPHWAVGLAIWVRDTIGRPLPALGRQGALCPFVPQALTLSSLFACDGMACDELEGLVAAVERATLRFTSDFPLQGEADRLKGLMVAFPNLQRERGRLLREVRTVVKPSLIAAGLTCGEFYEDNNDRSVRNSELRIAGSPVPCVIIRRLQSHDKIFLQSQPELYQIFLRSMNSSINDG